MNPLNVAMTLFVALMFLLSVLGFVVTKLSHWLVVMIVQGMILAFEVYMMLGGVL